MLCKYCKKTTHLIDDCPEIICKKCRIVGHPFWKCKNIIKGDKKKINNSNDGRGGIHKPVGGIHKSDSGINKSNRSDSPNKLDGPNKLDRTRGPNKLDGTHSENLYRKNIFSDLQKKTIGSNGSPSPAIISKPAPAEVPNKISEETYADIIISGDTKLSYYLKFQNKLWGELV